MKTVKAKRKPYLVIDLAGIRQLVDHPQEVDKGKAQWVIPSTLKTRNFKDQEERGEYWMLWADLDKNPRPLVEVKQAMDDVLENLFQLHNFEIYASKSARQDHQKGRLLIPLAKALSGSDWLNCQEILNDKLEACGITPDRASQGAAQLCYLPNRGEFYESHSERDGDSFDPLKMWRDKVADKKQSIAQNKAALEVANKEAADRRAALKLKFDTSGKPDLIGPFNEAFTVQQILLNNNYSQRGNTFRHPKSEGGSYSATVKDGRVHSLSSADPLYTEGGGVGGHDAFSAFMVLQHQGDINAALKDAGDNLITIDGEPWNRVKQREYMHNKDMDVLGAIDGFTQWQHASSELVEMPSDGDIGKLFDDVVLKDEHVQKMADAEFLYPNMIVRGHIGAYVAPANGGKTAIFLYICEKLSAMGLKVLYINVDGSPGDLKRHHKHAKQYGYKVIAPDACDGKSVADVINKFKAIANSNGRCDEYVFIVDTLKKFVDVIDKRQAKGFYNLARSLSVRGATVCFLGHCNKYKDDEGNSIYEGTADLRNDLDEMIYLDSSMNVSSNQLEITTRPDKVRAEFLPISFIIDFNNERKVSQLNNVLKILSKEERELLEHITSAIVAGNHSQKSIVEDVRGKTTVSDKKIREKLLFYSSCDNPKFSVSNTGRAKDLDYRIIVMDFEEDLL